jgi:hypothetical protein
MDDMMWLPISLAVMILPSTIGRYIFADLMMAKEIEELNKLNGWES